MKALLERLRGRIDAMSLRERAFVFGGAIIIVSALAFAAFLDGAIGKNRALRRELAQKQGEATELQAHILALAQARRSDPDRESRQRLEAMRRDLTTTEQVIAAEERKFTSPAQMRGVIEELLGRNRRVRLVELRTLPPSSVAEARGAAAKPPASPAKPAAPAERLVYRHGVEIVVTGGYLDLLAYLEQLEKLPTQLYWGAVELDAARHPDIVMKLTVYTLSLDRAWLNV